MRIYRADRGKVAYYWGMKVTVLLNPAARNGSAGRQKETIALLLQRYGLDATCVITTDEGHTRAVAKCAAPNMDAVVAVGGDGTIHHVASGIIESGADCALGVIPYGTGNDFVKMLKVPVHLESAIKILAKGKRKVVDYGKVEIFKISNSKSSPESIPVNIPVGTSERIAGAVGIHEDDAEWTQRFFVNTLGIGLDAEVGRRAAVFKMLPGFLGYLTALINTLKDLQKAEVQIILDDANRLFAGSFILSSVGNGTTSGGLFKLTPFAAFDDGWLDVCVVEHMTIPQLLMRIPQVLRGTHTGMKQYHAGKAKKVVIATDRGLPVHLDGEIVASDAQQLNIQIVEKGISVIVP